MIETSSVRSVSFADSNSEFGVALTCFASSCAWHVMAIAIVTMITKSLPIGSVQCIHDMFQLFFVIKLDGYLSFAFR